MNFYLRRAGSYLKRELLHHLPAIRPRKVLFDHLPKCGGTTLSNYLDRHYPKRAIFTLDGANFTESIKRFKELPEDKRHAYCLVKGHLANELINYADPTCLKITVLRDPVERIVSHYFYAKGTPKHYLYSAIHVSKMSLGDYAASDLSSELRNWYTTHFSGLPLQLAEKNPEKSVEDAVKVLLERYDLVGFLVNFSLFAERLRKRANLIHKYGAIKNNVTEDRQPVEKIPQATIERIEAVNHLDVAFYRRLKQSLN